MRAARVRKRVVNPMMKRSVLKTDQGRDDEVRPHAAPRKSNMGYDK